MKLALLTITALIAFAGNSILCRGALAQNLIDPTTFTAIRLISGACLLICLAHGNGVTSKASSQKHGLAAFFLFAYALAFSWAYIRLDAGVGALILFGCVQLAILAVDSLRGNRPSGLALLGSFLALAGLIYLLLPGSRAPDLLSGGLMALAGIAWGGYTLLGRGSATPITDSAKNFFLTIPWVALSLVILLLATNDQFFATPKGALFALASGALASGVGYAIWYSVLPSLKGIEAGALQMLVPLLTAIAGLVFFEETISLRLIIASVMILLGLGLVLVARHRASLR